MRKKCPFRDVSQMDKNVHLGTDIEIDMAQKGQKCPIKKRP